MKYWQTFRIRQFVLYSEIPVRSLTPLHNDPEMILS